MRLLIIEDEKRTAAHLQKGLSENGFTVDVAYDGFEGLELARAGRYALSPGSLVSNPLHLSAVLNCFSTKRSILIGAGLGGKSDCVFRASK
jgi:CheY-like chemotaxis protein